MPADEGLPAGSTLVDTALVLDALPRAIVITDLDGRIVGWNRAATAVYGWTTGEVLGMNVDDVVRVAVGPESADRPIRAARIGERWSGDLTVIRRDGRPVRTFAIVSPLRDDEGGVVGVVSAADDVTELRVLEQETADLHQHLRLALEAGQLGTWRWDRVTGVVVWDEALERLFGFEPGTFAGTFDAWLAALHPDDVDRCIAVVDQALVTHETYEVEHRVILPDGRVRWLQGRGRVIVGSDGEVSGTIGCTADVTARKEVELATAQRAADAVRAARLERDQRRRLEFLVRLNDLALGRCDHRELMRDLTAAAVPQLGDWCTIHFRAQAGQPTEVEVAHQDPGRTAWARDLLTRFPIQPEAPFGPGRVMRTGDLEHLADIDDSMIATVLDALPQRGDPAALHGVLDELRPRSSITAPLRSSRGIIGAMRLLTTDESGRRLDLDDVALVQAAAGRIAAALDASWEAEQQRHIAATLQRALLPRGLPSIPGTSLAVRYWATGAATEVGGDFYDVVPLTDDRWAFVIGDVCGKGADAAAVTAKARHTIRAAAMHGQDHHSVVRWLNDALHAGHRELFCTVAYATLQRLPAGRWELTSIAAGHPLPIVVRRGGQVEVIGSPGTLLGVLPTPRVESATVPLEPGDTVVLYTDGVNDVPPPYGLDDLELAAMVGAACAPGGGADAQADRLGAAIDARLPIARRRDDIALVVLAIDR